MFMSDATRPRGLPPTPELATDAEISGLFRLLEEATPPALSAACPDGCRCTHCRCMRAAFGRYAHAVAGVLNR
jgi:hypothetical protein